MPKGVPIATVAVDGAYNAGILAAQILATFSGDLAAKLDTFKVSLADKVEQMIKEVDSKP